MKVALDTQKYSEDAHATFRNLGNLQRHIDDLAANIVRDAIPDAIRPGPVISQRLRPSGTIAIVPSIKCSARDAELVQRALGWQVRLLDQLDNLGLL